MCGFGFSSTSKRFQDKIYIHKADSKLGRKATLDVKKALAISDRMEKFVIADLTGGLARFKRRLSVEQLERLIRQGKNQEAIDSIQWEDLSADLDPVVTSQIEAVASASEFSIQSLPAAAKSLALDTRNPAVMRFVNNNVGNLVVEMSSTGKNAIRNIIEQSLNQGLTPDRAARLIKESVGLTEKQTQQIMNKHLRMLNERAKIQEGLNDLKSRGLSNSLKAQNDVARLRLLTDDKIEETLKRDAKNREKTRKRAIARTELTRSVNGGQLETWRAAMGQGLIPLTSRKGWVTINDEDRSNICDDLDAVTKLLNELFFIVQTGESVDAPPGHTNCRSGLTLIIP